MFWLNRRIVLLYNTILFGGLKMTQQESPDLNNQHAENKDFFSGAIRRQILQRTTRSP
jgi:hypothetical protein